MVKEYTQVEDIERADTLEPVLDEEKPLVLSQNKDTIYCKVTFYVDGEVYGEEQSIAYGSGAVAPADPVIEGFTFTGWDTDFRCVTSDLIVKAQFDVNYYYVIFVADGVVFNTQDIAYGEAALDPGIPTKTGHVFAGWDLDFQCITGDLTVNARFAVDFHGGSF